MPKDMHTKAKSPRKKPGRRLWSKAVTEHSDAMDLEDSVFKGTPKEMARSIKRSADRSLDARARHSGQPCR
jgi:Protein of unknown function (DUF3175)